MPSLTLNPRTPAPLTLTATSTSPLTAVNQPFLFGGTTRTDLGSNVYLDFETTMTGIGPAASYPTAFEFLVNDDLNQSAGATSKVEPFRIQHSYGGSAMKGGRNSFVTYSTLSSQSSSANTDRNYVAIQGVWTADSSDGGVLPGTPKGAGFALSTLAHMNATATGFLNVSGGDFELVTNPSASVLYQSGIQVGGSIGSNGTVVDAAVWLSCGTGWGFSPIGYTTGFWIGAEAGAAALASTGTVMKVRGHSTLASAFDFTATTFTSYILSTNGFSLAAPAGNHSISIGRQDSVTSTPFIDFRSNGSAAVYDSRIIASGGDGTQGHGTLEVATALLQVDGSNSAVPTFRINAASGQAAELQVFMVNGATKLSVLAGGTIKTASGNESTGAGSAALGANSPASTLAAPYKWLTFQTSDGSIVYVPAWK